MRKKKDTHVWIAQIFETKLAKAGGTVRRKIRNVVTCGSIDELRKECRRRKFHLIMNGDDFVVFCNNEYFTVLE
jgi:hypothetical protein